MRTISTLNFKGGTGKTSLSTNLSHALARAGERVLLVDCDLQKNSSAILVEKGPLTLTQVIKGEAKFTAAIYPARDNLDVLPSDSNLDTAASHIVATGARAYYIIRNAMKQLQSKYEYVIFDHSPSYSPITESVLLASNEMLIPVELAPYAVTGLLEMISKLTDTLGGLDHEVKISGIVPFKLDQRYTMTSQYLASLQRRFGELVIRPVRTDSTISKAQSVHQTVFEYDDQCKAAEDFEALASYLRGMAA